MKWSGTLVSNYFPQFPVTHKVKGLSVINEAKVDAYLYFPCFLYDPINFDSLISGSSAILNPA